VTLIPFVRWNEMDLLANWSLAFDPTLSTTGHRSAGGLAKIRRDFAPWRTRAIAGVDVDHSPGSRFEESLRTTREGPVYTAYEVASPVYDYDVTFQGVSPYLQAETSPVQGIRVVAGLRYDWMEYEYATHLEPVAAGRHRRPEDTRLSYSHLSPKLGVAFELAPSLNVFTSYGHGFRAPSEGQLFRQGQTANTVGLRPVRVDSYEAGVRGALGAAVGFELSVYSMTKLDDILAYTNPDGTRDNVNAGETLHRGVEASVGGRLTSDLHLAASYSHARHTFQAWRPKPGLDLAGNHMETAPRDIGNLALSYSPSLLQGSRFSAEWTHLGRYWMDAENTHSYPGHGLLSVAVRVPITGDVGMFARMSNVTDRRFAENALYTVARGEEYAPGLPRMVYVGFSLSGGEEKR
jgi:iron complex outermembrane recepter protein